MFINVYREISLRAAAHVVECCYYQTVPTCQNLSFYAAGMLTNVDMDTHNLRETLVFRVHKKGLYGQVSYGTFWTS